ncbi:hypothetical protein C9E82_10610 [Paracoccus siganidrum]|uniref:YcaO domain-containing protein n=2 Tax=Paracoccus siganidrum TaxID=1276757 RepID=A0A419A9X2_9RHOB|nr:hypothetical protein D3P05_04540 [Paracoccus siganidrum]RMC35925.1 hypothetical protein C9E82_10610 [Paracoccus siganidrum]
MPRDVRTTMTELQRKPNELVGYWQRYDWRESFFTPSIHILQALTLDGRTASGAGRTREAAFLRCLGETAELHALAARAHVGANDFAARRDGIAAHPDADRARQAALLEAYERFAVLRWWHGLAEAQPLSERWLAGQGLGSHLETARWGAALRRRTGWWRIAGSAGPTVMICRSMSPEGQDPVLGFGADPDPLRAARKALRELFLMEMNLMELMAARRTGREAELQHVQDRILAYARRGPQLLPASPPVTPVQPAALPAPREWFGTGLSLHAITPADGPLAVWLCRPDLPAPAEDAAHGLPFL